MSRPAYGGQAVIEGVLIRGQRTVALACRRPDGGIYRYRISISSPLQRSRFARLPFVRGVVVLGESLAYGIRMLMREDSPLVRLIVAPGLLLQRITTRRPDPSMIEVAIASLEEALAGDRESEAAA